MKVINELKCKVRLDGEHDRPGEITIESPASPVGSYKDGASHVAIVVGPQSYVVDGLELIAAVQNSLRVH